MIAEADRLDAEVHAVLTHDTASYFAERAVAGQDPMPAGWRLRSSDNSKPLTDRAAKLRLDAAHAEATGALLGAAAASNTGKIPPTAVDIAIAASIERAMVASTTMAPLPDPKEPQLTDPAALIAAAEAREDAEADALVASIVGCAVSDLPDRAADLRRARIAAAAEPVDNERAEREAVIARILAA